MDDSLRFENHWLACMASLGGGAQVTRTAGALAVANPRVAGAAFNFLALRVADPERLALTLAHGAALLAAWGRPPALFLSPAAGDVVRLAERLQSLDWRPVLRQSVLLRNLPLAPAPAPNPDEIAVSEAESLDLWAKTLVDAYEVEPLAGEAISEAWTALATSPGEGARARFYLAHIGGEPVGTGLTWLRGALAGLYCGAVLPAYRRRGVETATVVRRLIDATADGCTVAMVQTETESPVAHLCVNRLGFHVAYERELWRPRSSTLIVD